MISWFGNLLIFTALFCPALSREKWVLPGMILAGGVFILEGLILQHWGNYSRRTLYLQHFFLLISAGTQLACLGFEVFPSQIDTPLFFLVGTSSFIVVCTLISLSLIRRKEWRFMFGSRELTLEEHFFEI